MSVTVGIPTGPGAYRVEMMHHPSHHVIDLPAAERWFERVFGRPSTSIAVVLGDSASSDFPRDYSFYTPISDVLFDTIDPRRFVVGGVQRYASIDQPHLKELGWYVDGSPELYRELKGRGIRVTGTTGQLLDADEVPMMAPGLAAPFHCVRGDVGLRYQFYPAAMNLPVDPRKSPGWVVPPVSDDDPLGIVCCSHHTILTGRPDRARTFVVDVLGGEIVHEGRDELRGASTTLFHLADALLEYGVPDPGTAAHEDWANDDPNDTYHAITWKVADLEQTERHLARHGVRIRSRSEDTVITDPATSLGVPWGFSLRSRPGDPRDTD